MSSAESFIVGKDASLEFTISTMQAKLAALGFDVEERSWLNPVDGIWSVHVRNRDCPPMFTNGKGASRLACLASALGEFFERLSTNYFWNHYYLGRAFAEGNSRSFVHYPQERWFEPGEDGAWPQDLLTPELQSFYNPRGSIDAHTLVDFNSGHSDRGICAIPYVRQRDNATVYFPVNIIGNLYVSNGMSAGNTPAEARRRCRKFLSATPSSASSVKGCACLMCHTLSSTATRVSPPAFKGCATRGLAFW